jgi:hypothetical protein
MNLIRVMALKNWWKSLKHRASDIIILIQEIQGIGNPENRILA